MLVNTWIRTVVSALITVPYAWFRTGIEIVRIPSKGRKARNLSSSIKMLRRSNSFNLEDQRTINHRALGKRTIVTSDMKEDDNDWKNWIFMGICGTFFACSDAWGGLGKAINKNHSSRVNTPLVKFPVEISWCKQVAYAPQRGEHQIGQGKSEQKPHFQARRR